MIEATPAGRILQTIVEYNDLSQYAVMLNAQPYIGFLHDFIGHPAYSKIWKVCRWKRISYDGNAIFESLVACVKLFPALKVCIVPDY